MTAKVSALPDSRLAGVPMRFVAGNKPPVTAGIKALKKMAQQQATYGETWHGVRLKKKRHVKTLNKPSSLAESVSQNHCRCQRARLAWLMAFA